MRFDTPYAAKSNEFTPAIPIRGLAMPILVSPSVSNKKVTHTFV